MKIFKSHFWYNKNQRNGIFLLFLIILVLQIGIYYGNQDYETINLDNDEVAILQERIDSLKQEALANAKPKIFPFNPNFISDFKGEQLGLSLEEIDRLHQFRSKGKFINSVKEFQKITLVSDSLLAKISPYFKLPDWVVERNKNKSRNNLSSSSIASITKQTPKTKDLNKATINDLMFVSDISQKLASRIINYRSKIGGFYFEDQLYEVFNITQNQAQNILEKFKILTKPQIIKKNINTIEFKELLKVPYIDYELCKQIFDYRDQVAELQNIKELKNVNGFPLKYYDRIVIYLKAE